MENELDSLVDQLSDLLDQNWVNEDALDALGSFGVIMAGCMLKLSGDEIDDLIFDGAPSFDNDQSKQSWISTRDKTTNAIDEALYKEDALELPFELTDEVEDSEMQAFAVGFMEVVFAFEERWFAKQTEEFAGLMLPIELASGLFVEEPDFAVIYEDESMLWSSLQELNEVLTDLYLEFQAPPEKKGPPKSAYGKPKNKK